MQINFMNLNANFQCCPAFVLLYALAASPSGKDFGRQSTPWELVFQRDKLILPD